MKDTRAELVNSMKELLWERGYDATSPNQVLERSGAGKGSFYHHFKGKKELAIAAMEERADELIDEIEAIFSSELPWLQQLEQYLLKPRDGLKGCRMGRIAQDPSLNDVLLRRPLKRYFCHLQLRIEQLLTSAQQQGELAKSVDPQRLSLTAISTLQGGFVISRSLNDEAHLRSACQGYLDLLSSAAR